VAGVAASCGRPPVRAYSAVFPRHPTIDESALIELLTCELELSSFALPVLGGSVVSGAVDYMREWEVPATSPNLFFWATLLRQAARDGVTAMLDGEGGDALFWLSPYLLADRLARGGLRSAVSLAGRFPSDAGRMPPSIVARLIRDWGIKGAVPYPLHRLRQRIRGRAAFAPRWFTQESIRLRFDTDPALDWKRSGAPRWWSALLDGVTGIGSTLVHDASRRRNASVGLHARHPLLDVDLIELVLGLPPELAFDARLSRPLLRESVRGLIPEDVRLRPTKSSFDALFHELLSGGDLAAARSLVLAPDAEVNAFVDPIRVRAELFDKGPSRTAGAL
jgi:asparagine synthase (glutamine-hydrolysing)